MPELSIFLWLILSVTHPDKHECQGPQLLALLFLLLRWFRLAALFLGWMWSFQSFFHPPKTLLCLIKSVLGKTLVIQNNFIFCLSSKGYEIRIQMFWLSPGQDCSLAKRSCKSACRRLKEKETHVPEDGYSHMCLLILGTWRIVKRLNTIWLWPQETQLKNNQRLCRYVRSV